MNKRTLFVVGAGAAALAVALVIVSLVGGGGDPAPAPTVSEVSSIAGLPQHGAFLGSPDAPHILVEYADIQCPYCAQYATGILPAIVDRYVRTGKLRLEFRGLAFIGPDSESALKIIQASAAQDKLWSVVEALYAQQGKENGDWVGGAIDGLTDSVPGLDLTAARASAASDAVRSAIAKNSRLAREDGIPGTPAFTIRPTGGTATKLDVKALDVSSFESAIDSALAG